MKILIGSNNINKLKEIQDILAFYPQLKIIELVSASKYELNSPDENGNSFIDNAIIKANYYYAKTSMPTLTEDSGLCVSALDGQPGIYSARWINGDIDNAINKIQNLLQAKETKDLSAKFICAVCYKDADSLVVFEEELEGTLAFPKKGADGFGYDPIFIPQGQNKTLAELGEEFKSKFSHRRKAIEKFLIWLQKEI